MYGNKEGNGSEKMKDVRSPKFEEVGVYCQADGCVWFEFCSPDIPCNNGDVFVYSKGVLWKMAISSEPIVKGATK